VQPAQIRTENPTARIVGDLLSNRPVDGIKIDLAAWHDMQASDADIKQLQLGVIRLLRDANLHPRNAAKTSIAFEQLIRHIKQNPSEPPLAPAPSQPRSIVQSPPNRSVASVDSESLHASQSAPMTPQEAKRQDAQMRFLDFNQEDLKSTKIALENGANPKKLSEEEKMMLITEDLLSGEKTERDVINQIKSLYGNDRGVVDSDIKMLRLTAIEEVLKSQKTDGYTWNLDHFNWTLKNVIDIQAD
jgi:hypothetical protein